uniref:Uncharacterized protein n=1 Tax=Phytophthora ramorum TaxID=164328 RepID=H3H165_PHYRM
MSRTAQCKTTGHAPAARILRRVREDATDMALLVTSTPADCWKFVSESSDCRLYELTGESLPHCISTVDTFGAGGGGHPSEFYMVRAVSTLDADVDELLAFFKTSHTHEYQERLRERKATLQEQQIRSLVGKSKSEATSTPTNQDEEAGDDFYVIFEPSRERLSIDQACNMGHVHEREALLRVNYRVPRTESFVNGYFQLIWRELGDARSEEPHYDERIIKLRDENSQGLNQEAPLQVQQPPDVPDAQSAPAKESSGRRSLDDRSKSSVVKGCFTVDVSHLPADSVCHVLFIACDRHMLHRTIALSTEGLAVQIADIEDPDSDDYDSDSTSEEGEYQKDGVEHKQEVEPGFTFFVGGEEFSHPNSVFAGQSFPDVEAFENFLRELRVRKQRRLQEKREQLDKEAQHAQQDHTEEYQLQQQQEAGQVAEEVSNKSDDAESPGKQQEDEVRPPEKPTDTTEQDHSNQEDDDESEN